MKATRSLYTKLFTTAFAISAMTFGSGYVIVSVIKKRFVDELKWIDEDEMLNLIALAQSSPGVMTANTALLVGYKVGGGLGALTAVTAVALPPLFTIYVITQFYNYLVNNTYVAAALRGMQAGACAVIIDVVLGMYASVSKDRMLHPYAKWIIMTATFVAAFILNISFILIVLIALLLGLVAYYVSSRASQPPYQQP